MKKTIFCLLTNVAFFATAQDTSSSIHFSGYMEAYYSYDFTNPKLNTKPFFIYNFNKHNEFNINLAFIKAAYWQNKVRANLAMGAGTYMNANYTAEPGTLKNLVEANVGYRLSKQKNLWFDIGILPSHIGYETAIGKDNWTLTRSIAAENSPYFEAGAKLSYTTIDSKLQVSLLALNGWQRIQRVQNNSLMSWGTQVYFKPNDKFLINYSTFIGTDKPDTSRLWRYYHNLYTILQFTKTIGITTGFDIGHEQRIKNGDEFNVWFTPTIILRCSPTDKWALALRGEYFNDKHGVIINTGTSNGFKTVGSSLNVDYLPVENVFFRVEGKYLNSKDPIFEKAGSPKRNNISISFSSAISF